MIWLWRYLLGFLTIKLEGENIEQIINVASANGIGIWNLYYQSGCIYGNISIKNFLKLYKVKRTKRCKIKIIKKCGLAFKLKKYNKRIGFVAGMCLFFLILFFLTNFVWIINIEGNNKIPTQEIKKSCKELGIFEGAFKSKINSKYDAQRLQLIQNDIAWCSLNIEGCVLNVNLTEAPPSDKQERQTPSNLKALTDGKIIKIDVTSGNVPIKVGDVVSKGDLLVSGIIQNPTSTVFVHSSGEIIAETKRVFSAQGDFVQSREQETGEITTRYTINFFNLRIPFYLGKIKNQHIYKSEVKYLKLFGNKIPIKIAEEQYIITQNTNSTYDKETLVEMLYEDIKKQVENFKFINSEEIDREIVTTDKGILLKITYNCTENIAVQDEILLSKEN